MASSSEKKILLIGWDAADWEMIDPLLAAGQMPALAQLIGGGLRGNLATLQPVLSPMLWTSIATGKRANKHGICGFTEPLPDASGVGPVRSTSRKGKALWNILGQNGLKSNVVGWFATSPAEPINGVMVSDQFFNRPAPKESRSVPVPETPPPAKPDTTVHPMNLNGSLAALRVTPDSLFPEDLAAFIPRLAEIDLKSDDRPLKLARRLSRIASVQNIATSLIQSEPWNLMAVYYDGIDQFGHEFMPYHPPRMDGVSEPDFELYRDVMRGCYRFHDMMLHALLQYVDARTTVILISDHGYECGRRRPALERGKKDPEGCHRPFGIACLKGPGLKKNEHLYGASILDVTPTILTLLNLPVGCDMDGRPWLEAFEKPVQPERIFSWEGIGDDQAGLHVAPIRQDPAEAAQAIEQLVELGYIAAPGPDARQTVRDTIRCNKVNLVRALFGTPNEAEAIPLLKELAAGDGPNEWAPLTLAQCEMRLGQLPEARARLEATAPATQQTSQVQLLFAELAFAEGNPAAALDHLTAAGRAGSGADSPIFLNQLGRAFLQLKRWDEAAAVFQKSLAAEPDNPAAFDGLAHVHLEQHNPESAVENSLQAVGLIHYFPEAHYRLAAGLEQLGRGREAILAYETALGMGCQPGLVHTRLAELYRTIDSGKAAGHAAAAIRSRKPRIYRADIKSKLPSSDNPRLQPPIPAPGPAEQKMPGDYVTIVSGLPRSGTSLMMQMLQAGGARLLTDNQREADEHNPRGYFEHEGVKNSRDDLSWLEQAGGKAVKVIHLLLPHLPAGRNYRVIFMVRDLAEVIASQRAMLAQQGRPAATLTDGQLGAAFEKQLAAVRQWLAGQPNFRVLYVNHQDVVADPEGAAGQINLFLGGGLAVAKMAAAVDPALHRQRNVAPA